MYNAGDPPVDLLVRTSGVSRLSDFMLWQCHQDTQIVFLDVLWPDFDLWSFLPVLWEWQWRTRKAEHTTDEEENTNTNPSNSRRSAARKKKTPKTSAEVTPPRMPLGTGIKVHAA